MSLPTPCVVLFKENYTEMFPVVVNNQMSFKILNAENLSSSNATIDCTMMDSASGDYTYLYYTFNDNVEEVWNINDGWYDPRYRAIYVTDFGGSIADNFEYAAQAGDIFIFANDLASASFQFNSTVTVPQDVWGQLEFTYNNVDSTFIEYNYSLSRIRYLVNSSYLTTYQNGAWVSSDYQNINVIGWVSGTTMKPAVPLWIVLNSVPVVIKTYSLGWRYTPLSS